MVNVPRVFAIALGVLLGLVAADWLDAAQRTYHKVPLAKVATTARTHVETEGLVVYSRLMKDGDRHVTIVDAAGVKLVVEIIPAIPLPAPRVGDRIRVRGISRFDRAHGWGEIHPAEQIDVLAKARRR